MMLPDRRRPWRRVVTHLADPISRIALAMPSESSPAVRDGDDLPTSAAFLDERSKLPAVLQPVYDELVREYRFHAVIHYRQPFVSYKILRSLVLAGWHQKSD